MITDALVSSQSMSYGTPSPSKSSGIASHIPYGPHSQSSAQVRRRSSVAPQPARSISASPGMQSPDSPSHAPLGMYRQVVSQRTRCVPHIPQGAIIVVPGSQTAPGPSTHSVYSQTPDALQKRSCDPHRPQSTTSSVPGSSH